jgi:transposase-like protein
MKRCGTGKNGFAPLLAEHIRRKRKGKVDRRWYVDETYVRVKGKCAIYIAPLIGKAICGFNAQRHP